MKKKWMTLTLALSTIGLVACSENAEENNEKEEKVELSAEQKEKLSNNLDFETLYPNEEIRGYAQKMIGTEAPDFALNNLKGEEVKLSDLKGQNVLVEIASTTCSACIEAYPAVATFKDLSKDKVKVLTVFPNETKEDVELFFTNNKYERNEEVIAGEGQNMMIADYQVQYTPTFLFVDKEGIIQFVHIGADINEVVLSSMSDLSFKTDLSAQFNTDEEIEVDMQETEANASEGTSSK